MNYNKIVIVGRFTADPELKTFNNGETEIANFAIAVNRVDKTDKVDFFRCKAFGKLAELILSYCKKGSSVLVEGKMELNSYDKDGDKRLSPELKAEVVRFLTPKGDEIKPAEIKSMNLEEAPF